MSLDKAIEIAKKIDPGVGPSLEIDRKNMSEPQLRAKLQDFFAVNKKAAEIALAHPGKSFVEIKQSIDNNISAHVNNDFHVLTFVGNVLAKKGDLASLAQSCARRIVLSDPRILNYFVQNPKADKIKLSQTLSDDLQTLLVNYFENVKGKKLNSEAMVDELTTQVTKKVAETLKSFGKAA